MMNRLAEKGLRLEFWITLTVVAVLAGWQLRALEQAADDAITTQAEQAAAALRSALRGMHQVWLVQGQPGEAGPLETPPQLGLQDGLKWWLRMNAAGWPVDARPERDPQQVTGAEPCERLWQALWASPALRYAGKGVEVVPIEDGCLYRLPGGDIEYRMSAGEVSLKKQN